MHVRERHRTTLQVLSERGFVSVQQLTQLLGSSQATVRRDLEALAGAGKLRRIRGGAERAGQTRRALVGQPAFFAVHGKRLADKRAIAREAVARVAPGSSIIIDGGTTTFAMVEFLRDVDVRVLTTSFPVAESLLRATRAEVTLPGGSLLRDQQMVLSPFEEPVIDSYWAQQLFIGAQALTRQGLLQSDPLLVQAQRRLLSRTERVVVLADSGKFTARGSLALCRLDALSEVITDERVRDEDVALLERAGVEVTVVPRARRRRNGR